jgi:hypothetical protein
MMVSTRESIIRHVSFAWLGLVCAVALLAVTWFAQAGGASGAVSPSGAVSAHAAAGLNPPGGDDPPWT